MSEKLAIGTRVRFTPDWLARRTPAEARRYQGRTGFVHGYRLGADRPIILFPKDGRRGEQKLFEVDTRRLEILTENPAMSLAELIEKLRTAGFVETTYPGQAGTFLTKRLPISEMPYAAEHIVDNDLVGETDTAVVEFVPDPLYPGGGVQMTIANCDYSEDCVAARSEDGLALLRDAGVSC